MSALLAVKNATIDIPIFDVNRSFRNVLKQYCVGGKINDTKSSKIVSVRALDNISFSLQPGDRLGLVGHNGSGKTTLLRLLAGVYKPMIGEVTIQGKMTALFNASLGIDMDDSGINNIYVVGMHLGMNKKEINQVIDEIIMFSGLGNYINLPVRTYSAGMLMRLSFSIATALEPNILLLDENISAGDAQFAKDAEVRLKNFYDKIEILVLASHSDDIIRRLCNKALLLKNGQVYSYGVVETVLNDYYDSRYHEQAI